MFCMHCGRLGDYVSGLTCKECLAEIDRINERVYLMGLLKKARLHCPRPLQLEIDALFDERNIKQGERNGSYKD